MVKQLFTGGRAAGTALIWVVYFMNLLNLYFLNSWLPTIISDADIPVATAIRLTALFQVGGIGGALVLGAILDRWFSFWILAGCYLWAAVCVFFIGAASGSTVLLGVTITSAGLGIIGGQNAVPRADRRVLSHSHALDRCRLGARDRSNRIDCRSRPRRAAAGSGDTHRTGVLGGSGSCADCDHGGSGHSP